MKRPIPFHTIDPIKVQYNLTDTAELWELDSVEQMCEEITERLYGTALAAKKSEHQPVTRNLNTAHDR